MAVTRPLLTVGNPKTQKGEKSGFLTAILHLAPFKLSGRNVCPDATPQCVALCLNTAGRGGIISKGKRTNAIQRARIRKTRFFFDDRASFLSQLNREIDRHVTRAYRLDPVPCVRLNGTSDIPWERIARHNTIERFPYVTFYDYTKSEGRMRDYLDGKLPHNYSLTFSRSETNWRLCVGILRAGGNVAVVFSTKRGQALPLRVGEFSGQPLPLRVGSLRVGEFPVIDGDVSDLRFRDPSGVIVGLRAKGKARKHSGGFVMAVK